MQTSGRTSDLMKQLMNTFYTVRRECDAFNYKKKTQHKYVFYLLSMTQGVSDMAYLWWSQM